MEAEDDDDDDDLLTPDPDRQCPPMEELDAEVSSYLVPSPEWRDCERSSQTLQQ